MHLSSQRGYKSQATEVSRAGREDELGSCVGFTPTVERDHHYRLLGVISQHGCKSISSSAGAFRYVVHAVAIC